MTGTAELLKDPEILNEVNTYKWCQSEKEGQDIGFERASREWINLYSKNYLAKRVNKTMYLWLNTSPILNFLNKKISV